MYLRNLLKIEPKLQIRRKPKILHLPSTVGGNPQAISEQMKIMGIRSQSWAISPNPLGLGKGADRFVYHESENFIIKEIKKLICLRYVFLFDIVFFNFGSSLYTPFPRYRYEREKGLNYVRLWIYSYYRKYMQIIELKLIKYFKLKVYVQYQGTDARLKDYCKKNFRIMLPEYRTEYSKNDFLRDKTKKNQIKILEEISESIFSLNPDLMNTLPAKTRFLPYCHVDLNYWCPRKDKGGGNREILRIGHAPSNRQVKGTQEILDVIKQLKINFEDRFEFVLIENVDHEDAMRLYDSIDILIDQIYVGWYGGLAVEVMALAKPVLCYIRESDLRFIPQEMAQDLPVINVDSNTLLTMLSSTIEMPREQLLELGRRSRSYVEKWHCPTKVVQHLIEVMNLK
jgi:hypothetical protein